jgi:hypothetical protein
MDEPVIDRYRQWLIQAIEKDSEDLYKVPCPRCGTTRYRSQAAPIMCENRLACNMARENLSDAVICVGQQGHQSADANKEKNERLKCNARGVTKHRKLNTLWRKATTEKPVGVRMRPCQLGQSNHLYYTSVEHH